MFEGVEGVEMFEMFEEFPNPKFQIPKPKTQIPKLFKPKTLQTPFPPILALFYINKFLNQFSYKGVASYVIIYNFANGLK